MLDAEAIIVGDLKTQLISFGGHDERMQPKYTETYARMIDGS